MALSADWFMEQARLGNEYNACSAGAVTLSTLSATCTGLCLNNPYGSGVNLIIKRMRFAPSTAPAGASVVGVAVSPAVSTTAVVHTTPAVIHNSICTGSNVDTGKAYVDAACTLPAAPVWLRPMGGVVAASSITPPLYVDDAMGSIILPPGTSVSLSYLTTAAVGMASVTWVEVPIV